MFRMLVIQLLAGAQINDVTPQKATALHLAAAHDRAAICAALLGEHIHCDAVDDGLNNGKPPPLFSLLPHTVPSVKT